MHSTILSLLLFMPGQFANDNFELHQLRPDPELQREVIEEPPVRVRRSDSVAVRSSLPDSGRGERVRGDSEPGRIALASFEELASFEDAVEPSVSTREVASTVLQQALTPFSDRTLAGKRVSLIEGLQVSSDRSQQLNIVRAYWRALTRIAEYHWSTKETALLASLARPANPRDQSLLAAARDAAAAHEIDVELSALSAQRELGEALKWGVDQAPLPTDLPLVSEYKTNFETIFRERKASSKVFQLAKMLPVQHRLIVARARAVQSAFDAAEGLVEEYNSGNGNLTNLLEAVERLSAERRAFISILRDYNYAIADYSLAVVGNSLSAETLVSTLVRHTTRTRVASQSTQQTDRGRQRPNAPSRTANSKQDSNRFRSSPPQQDETDADDEAASRAPVTRPSRLRSPRADDRDVEPSPDNETDETTTSALGRTGHFEHSTNRDDSDGGSGTSGSGTSGSGTSGSSRFGANRAPRSHVQVPARSKWSVGESVEDSQRGAGAGASTNADGDENPTALDDETETMTQDENEPARPTVTPNRRSSWNATVPHDEIPAANDVDNHATTRPQTTSGRRVPTDRDASRAEPRVLPSLREGTKRFSLRDSEGDSSDR